MKNILKIILYVCLISSAIWTDEVYNFVTSSYSKLNVTDNRNEVYYEEDKEKIDVKKRLDKVDKFVALAKSQIGKTLTYNPEYVALKYPMGDINISKGVCTDVVVRALRGLDIDLQERIYKHKKSHPKLYKGLYGSNRLNTDIDHRRVKNIQVYLRARGYTVKEDVFKAGDIVVWKVGKRFDHIGICSSKLNAKGEPYIVHNIGSGAKEENVLRDYKIVDHFRIFDRNVSGTLK